MYGISGDVGGVGLAGVGADTSARGVAGAGDTEEVCRYAIGAPVETQARDTGERGSLVFPRVMFTVLMVFVAG